MSDGGELATIRAFANKAGEHVVRVAGVRTIYADADAAEISPRDVFAVDSEIKSHHTANGILKQAGLDKHF